MLQVACDKHQSLGGAARRREETGLALKSPAPAPRRAQKGETCLWIVKKGGPSDVTMSSSDWGPRAEASHPLEAVDQRAMAVAVYQRSFVVCSGPI